MNTQWGQEENTQWWRDDDLLLHELGEAVRGQPSASASVIAAAQGVYTWRTVDAEIAQLAYDSLGADSTEYGNEEAEILVGMRTEQAPLRMLTFEATGLIIELGVTRDALVGQLVPPCAGTIEVRRADDGTTEQVGADDLGSFTISPVPVGVFTLHCRTEDGRMVVTDALRL